MITLILGGARSGKSRLAEQLARTYQQQNLVVFYLATAQAFDNEMQNRILHHQQHRPKDWQTIETPIYLSDTICQLQQQSCVILIDCLTLWLTNLLLANDNLLFQDEYEKFLQTLHQFPKEIPLILVSNETGLGIVPLGEISRKFVDEMGFLHQKIAQIADNVLFCVAGLPMTLKGSTIHKNT